MRNTPNDLRRELTSHLKLMNIEGLPRDWFNGRSGAASVARDAIESLVETINEGDTRSTLPWDELQAVAADCRRCRLCEGRNTVVFGDGNRKTPQLVFVGEGPGAEEDKRGIPFVGRAGQLLTDAITKGMGLKREDVYICNVVKCRPPENRAPLPDEVAACSPFLYRQLEILNPKVIVTLGAPAQKTIVGLEQGITKIRGNWQSWRGIRVMPTLHPAYLLRNPPAKKDFWHDLQLVMEELGIPKP